MSGCAKQHRGSRAGLLRCNELQGDARRITEVLLAECDREVERSRHALEQVPEGEFDWKPHEKSMICGYLVSMVATIPTWISMQINQAELGVAPAA